MLGPRFTGLTRGGVRSDPHHRAIAWSERQDAGDGGYRKTIRVQHGFGDHQLGTSGIHDIHGTIRLEVVHGLSEAIAEAGWPESAGSSGFISGTQISRGVSMGEDDRRLVGVVSPARL